MSDKSGCFVINPMKIGMGFFEFMRPGKPVNPESKPKITAFFTKNAGYESGIQFLLNPGISDYYPNILYNERPTAGLYLLIYFGDQDDDPSVSPIFIAPGTHTVIAMTAERHRTKARQARFLNFYTKKQPCAENITYKWLSASKIQYFI